MVLVVLLWEAGGGGSVKRSALTGEAGTYKCVRMYAVVLLMPVVACSSQGLPRRPPPHVSVCLHAHRLRFSVAFWHTFKGDGGDPFGSATKAWPWEQASSPMQVRLCIEM
jgi:hypothetical protein